MGAHIVIDLTTTGAEVTRRAAAELDVAWLDSPVSGGPEAAEKGDLSLMVGGTQELFDWVRPVLADIANTTTLMGPLGAGQTAMMINQAIVGTTYVLLAEVLAQAKAAGIDPNKLVVSLKGGMGDSTMLQQVFPQMVARSFEPPRASIAQTLEELQQVRTFNEASRLTLPVQEIAIDQFRHFAEEHEPDTDSAAISTIYDGVVGEE
jgi:3-hydroxyisobutyrate dehydrogenase